MPHLVRCRKLVLWRHITGHAYDSHPVYRWSSQRYGVLLSGPILLRASLHVRQSFLVHGLVLLQYSLLKISVRCVFGLVWLANDVGRRSVLATVHSFVCPVVSVLTALVPGPVDCLSLRHAAARHGRRWALVEL